MFTYDARFNEYACSTFLIINLIDQLDLEKTIWMVLLYGKSNKLLETICVTPAIILCPQSWEDNWMVSLKSS